MCDKISKNQYSIELQDDQSFFFNVKDDGEGNVLLQNGCPTKHARIMFSSKNLMKNCERNGVFHLDGTYKLIKTGFPVFVFGISDIQHTFHPIAFCVSSNEEETDFIEFYKGLLDLADEMGIELDPDFIMQDACGASYNAARSVGLNGNILMCYFHVLYNIKKLWKHKLELIKWLELKSFIQKLHLSRSERERDSIWDKFKTRYSNSNSQCKKSNKNILKGENGLFEYVRSTWYESRFNKWMIYCNPPGWANTNNPIESFNATIKRDFFMRKRHSVFGAVLKLELIVKYYSNKETPFHMLPKYSDKLHDKAKKLSSSDFKFSGNLVKIDSRRILINKKSCSCPQWLKWAICYHSLALSNLKDYAWFGTSYSGRAKKFFVKCKRGAKKGGRTTKAKSALNKQ